MHTAGKQGMPLAERRKREGPWRQSGLKDGGERRVIRGEVEAGGRSNIKRGIRGRRGAQRGSESGTGKTIAMNL